MCIPEVEKDLQEMVRFISKYNDIVWDYHNLIWVRVFGSYERGDWNPENSDIDIHFLFDVAELSDKDRYSIEAASLRMTSKYRNRLSFHIDSRLH